MRIFYTIIFFSFFSFNLFCRDHRFVIDICSYNNKDWVKKNLDSVFSQIDDNYHVFFTNDCSTDDTYELVKKYIHEKNLDDKVTLVSNDTRRKQLANHYRVIQWCNPEDIIVVLDGDDAFKNQWVLSKLRRVYKNPDIWMTYGQFKNWPDGKRGYCKKTDQKLIDSNVFRTQNWIWGHLRSYRAWVTKEIKLEDLIISEIKRLDEIAPEHCNINKTVMSEIPQYIGKFFPASADCALGYPMLELARYHIKYIRKVLYLRNIANTINTFKTQFDVQQYCGRYIRASKSRYAPLSAPNNDKRIDNNAKADVILFLENNVTHLEQILLSMYTQIKQIGNIFIFYKQDFNELSSVKKEFPQISFKKITEKNMQHVCIDALKRSSQNYVFMCKKGCILTRKLNLYNCLHLLESTKAYACNFTINMTNPPAYFDYTGLEDCYFMQYALNPSVDSSIALYRKKDVLDLLDVYASDNSSLAPNLEPADKRKILLFFDQPYIEKKVDVKT